jgi:hypothetical protein
VRSGYDVARVEAAVARLDYRTDPAAARLARNQSFRFAFILPMRQRFSGPMVVSMCAASKCDHASLLSPCHFRKASRARSAGHQVPALRRSLRLLVLHQTYATGQRRGALETLCVVVRCRDRDRGLTNTAWTGNGEKPSFLQFSADDRNRIIPAYNGVHSPRLFSNQYGRQRGLGMVKVW